jgi:hypothetical protein
MSEPDRLLLWSRTMANRPTSAAASLYPHLKSFARDEIVGRKRVAVSVADAMYPALAPKPKPKWGYQWRADWAEANARAWGRR